MALPRPIAGLINDTQRGPGVEFMARRRTVSVNTAPYLLPNLARQGNASGRRVIGALHSHQLGREYDSHLYWNTGTLGRLCQFGGMKIHPIRGTASTATFTDGKH